MRATRRWTPTRSPWWGRRRVRQGGTRWAEGSDSASLPPFSDERDRSVGVTSRLRRIFGIRPRQDTEEQISHRVISKLDLPSDLPPWPPTLAPPRPCPPPRTTLAPTFSQRCTVPPSTKLRSTRNFPPRTSTISSNIDSTSNSDLLPPALSPELTDLLLRLEDLEDQVPSLINRTSRIATIPNPSLLPLVLPIPTTPIESIQTSSRRGSGSSGTKSS